MAYSRTYTEVIHGSTDIRVGDQTHSVSWSEPVSITITVDDDPFQHSVGALANHVDLVTASVIATEGAQIASKRARAKEVGGKLTGGFRQLVLSEIEQQMLELKVFMPVKFMEIQGLAERCAALRVQMQSDFKRIEARYVKLFTDLNAELRLGVVALDKPAFELQDAVRTQLHDHSAAPVVASTLGAQEGASARAQLMSHTIRSGARRLIDSSRRLVTGSRRLARDLDAITAKDGASVARATVVFLPVLAIDADGLGAEACAVLPDEVARDPQRRGAAQLVARRLLEESGWSPIAPEARAKLFGRVEAVLPGYDLTSRQLSMVRRLLAAQQPAVIF